MEQHWYVKTYTEVGPFIGPAGKTRKQAKAQMILEWNALSPAQRTEIRRCGYENKARTYPYMQAVGHNGQCIYDHFTLADLMAEADE